MSESLTPEQARDVIYGCPWYVTDGTHRRTVRWAGITYCAEIRAWEGGIDLTLKTRGPIEPRTTTQRFGDRTTMQQGRTIAADRIVALIVAQSATDRARNAAVREQSFQERRRRAVEALSDTD